MAREVIMTGNVSTLLLVAAIALFLSGFGSILYGLLRGRWKVLVLGMALIVALMVLMARLASST